jgi:hypothetical protein
MPRTRIGQAGQESSKRLKTLISLLLPDYCFMHVRREGNQVAHSLAQLAKRSKQCKVIRFNTTPLLVRRIVELEAKDIVMPSPACNFVS